MKVTIDNTIKDDFHTIEIDANDTVENLKILVEVASSISIDEQLLVFQNSFLDDNSSKLRHLGICDGDISK